MRSAGALLMAAMLVAVKADAGPVDGRWRVCVIALNESDEIEAFRYHLDADLFAIVDVRATALARAATRRSVAERGWIFDACAPDLTCDVLVISGEFAGHFFGSGPISLSLRELEEASCDDRCAGLFRHPQEVYLLACNTLASKAEDSRTPDEYRRVLLDHGFDRAAADRVVLLRYGPLGPSFRESVRRVFAGVPRLYGFSSVAPRAQFSAPMLANYLRRTHGLSATVAGDQSRNTALLEAFRGTSLTQTSGLMMDEPAAAERKQICTLYDEQRALIERLMIGYVLLARPDALRFVPPMQTFLSRHPPAQFGRLEQSVFMEIKGLDHTRSAVVDLVQRLQVSALQLELAHFAALVGWIDPAEFHRLAAAGIAQLLSHGAAGEEVDIVCEITRHERLGEEFDADEIPPSLYADPHGVRLIACLAPNDRRIAPNLVVALRGSDPILRQWAAYALAQVPRDDGVMADLVPYLRDRSAEVAGRIRYIFQTQPSLSPALVSAASRIDPTLFRR